MFNTFFFGMSETAPSFGAVLNIDMDTIATEHIALKLALET